MRTEVKSSLLRAVEYEPLSKTLIIEFRGKADGEPGKVYRYANVDQATYDKFITAKSLGSHFLKEIKPAHACTKVKEENDDASNQESVSKAPPDDEIPF
jgi:hypothetical protein